MTKKKQNISKSAAENYNPKGGRPAMLWDEEMAGQVFHICSEGGTGATACIKLNVKERVDIETFYKVYKEEISSGGKFFQQTLLARMHTAASVDANSEEAMRFDTAVIERALKWGPQGIMQQQRKIMQQQRKKAIREISNLELDGICKKLEIQVLEASLGEKSTTRYEPGQKLQEFKKLVIQLSEKAKAVKQIEGDE